VSTESLAESRAAAAAAARSPFTGADLCAQAGLPLRPGARGPVFDDDVWDFTTVAGIAVQVSPAALCWDFTRIRNPAWRRVAKEYMFALLVPGHEQVRVLPHAYRTPRSLLTCRTRLDPLVRWLNWLTEHGVTRLGDVEEHHCAAHLEHRSHRRDSHGRSLAAFGATTRSHTAAAIIELALYGELFTDDRYRPGFRPWAGRSAAAVTGNRGHAENKTQPIPPQILQPILAAALYLVDTLGPHIGALEQARLADIRREQQLPARRAVDYDVLLDVVRRHVDQRRPFDALPDYHIRRRLRQGYSPDDPLLAVNLTRIAQEAGYRQFYSKWLPRLRGPIAEAAAQVGVDNWWGRDAPPVIRADGAGTIPWTLPLARRGVQDLANIVRTGCLLVTATLSGMRASELMELRRGCHRRDADGPGPVRHHLTSKIIKGQPWAVPTTSGSSSRTCSARSTWPTSSAPTPGQTRCCSAGSTYCSSIPSCDSGSTDPPGSASGWRRSPTGR
jgi:hypothetical protein